MENGLRLDKTEKEVFDLLLKEVVYDSTSPTYLRWLSGRQGRRDDLVCGCIKTKENNEYGIFCFNYKEYYIHRFIFYIHNQFLPEMVDHIDGCGVNNQPENLRSSCYKTNPMNLTKIRPDSTSGTRGVSFDKTRNKWRGYVTLSGKQVMKRFSKKEDAENFAIIKRKELFGDFCGD